MDEKSIPKTPHTPSIDRGIEKAIVALKKGAHLLKYGRRGKPKFCPFRLSSLPREPMMKGKVGNCPKCSRQSAAFFGSNGEEPDIETDHHCPHWLAPCGIVGIDERNNLKLGEQDEKLLIWYSGKEEKQLKLNSVTKIIPGQQTVNFQRQPQPEKECQSFSLVYGNGERSLDLICKDKDQAESWFIGLMAVVSRSHHSRQLANLRHGRGVQSCVNSPISHVRRKQNLGLLEESVKISQVRSLCGSPRPLVERGSSDGLLCSSNSLYPSEPRSSSNVQTVMESMLPPSPSLEHEYFQENNESRMSLPGAFSSSNHWSSSMSKDDVLRDVLMWGEGIDGRILGGGSERPVSYSGRCDALLPKLLESTGTLDVKKISCGGKHAALVTRQGEVFCWGEEKGGRLGHKINMDVSHPKVVESLIDVHVESVACGEYHTCALTLSGELYTWGECGHANGLLYDGRNISWWLPHRVLGPLDGICIVSVACGEWHTAVVSSSGQLFTYGDGIFGVLGHGNLKSISQPKEVESLKGLRVKSVACGPWHTAAVVEIMVDRSKRNSPCGKLFTWGDSDKGRLGHSDKEKKLLPTCVASLVDHDFIQVSCGRMLTVALTVTGVVCTMGSAVHGQLGNPLAEDKSIAIVEGNLKGQIVKEISSGSYHVVVLTSKGNVYTWGMGANGRLGLGNTEDRDCPCLVEALKDKQVLSIACGSSFTSAICLHKSVSSSDQSICSGCRMIFGFTRKKHNCYNCGLVFCHACSSKKAMNASLALNKSKQYRVCDPCFAHLRNHVDSRLRQETPSPRPPLPMCRPSSDLQVDREEPTSARSQIFSPKPFSREEMKCIEVQTSSKQGSNQQYLNPASPLLSIPPRWGQVACPPLFSTHDKENPMIFAPPPKDGVSILSPSHAHQSPPKTRAMTPNTANLEKHSTEWEKMLKEEVQRLRAEAKNLAKQCQIRSDKIQQYQQRMEETWSLAREEVARCKAAKELIKVLTTRLNAMAEKFSSGRELSNVNSIVDKVDMHLPQLTHIRAESLELNEGRSMFGSMHLSREVHIFKDRKMDDLCVPPLPSHDTITPKRGRDQHHGHTDSLDDSFVARTDAKQNGTNALKTDWVEQDEPGVYITFTVLQCGQKGLKRVRFSRKHFNEKEAQRWWEENQLRVYEKYNIEGIVSSSANKTSGG